MENHVNERYRLNLNRLFNIQTKENLLWTLVVLGISIFLIAREIYKHSLEVHEIVIAACGCVAIILIKLLSTPARLIVSKETIKFEYNTILVLIITELFRRGRVMVDEETAERNNHKCAMYNIKSIEYFQTPFEKVFSCGHIKITGDVSEGPGPKAEDTFVIYGVRDFDNISAWMKEFVKVSNNNEQA